MLFKLHSKFKPTGDQPEAIAKIVDGIERGVKDQVLLGVTGSGKNFYNSKYNSRNRKICFDSCS